jgi:pimeloyl-ACP methyl ester carboxylesterase
MSREVVRPRAGTRYRWFALVGGILLLLLAARVVRAVVGELRDLKPQRIAVPDVPPVLENGPMQTVTFRTRDGIEIRGWYAASRNGAAIVLGHGYGANRTQLLPEARLLVEQGYGVLAFDYRAHGQSGGDMTSYGDHEREDVRAAVSFVASQSGVDAQRLGALGFSMGAPPMALVAAEDRRLRAVVLEGVTSSLRDACLDESGALGWVLAEPVVLTLRARGVRVDEVRVDAAVARFGTTALLAVQGALEDSRLAARTRQVYAAAGGPKRYLVVQKAGHGGYFANDHEAYARALTSFFASALAADRPPSTR